MDPAKPTVVLAYDGSQDAANAIACAARLVPDSRAIVVHAFEGFAERLLHTGLPDPGASLVAAARELSTAETREAERIADEGVELAARAGLDATPLAAVQRGSAWRTVIERSEQQGASLIVAGTRGRSGIRSVLLGSVSNGLVHHSRVPVLIVHPDYEPGSAGGPALLCFDGSEGANRAVAAASGLLRSRDAIALHLWEPWAARAHGQVPGVDAVVAGMAHELDEIAERQSSRIAADGADLATEAGFRARPLSVRCERSLWSEALDVAAGQHASVIVLGSRGLSGIGAMLGSVSHGVVHHARRPVLVVPDGAASSGPDADDAPAYAAGVA